jgi:hypothetical protein
VAKRSVVSVALSFLSPWGSFHAPPTGGILAVVDVVLIGEAPTPGLHSTPRGERTTAKKKWERAKRQARKEAGRSLERQVEEGAMGLSGMQNRLRDTEPGWDLMSIFKGKERF